MSRTVAKRYIPESSIGSACLFVFLTTPPKYLNRSLSALGVYQDGLAKNLVDDKEVKAHVFEYTTQLSIDPSLKFKGLEKGIVPVSDTERQMCGPYSRLDFADSNPLLSEGESASIPLQVAAALLTSDRRSALLGCD